jgi:hypothetical protein
MRHVSGLGRRLFHESRERVCDFGSRELLGRRQGAHRYARAPNSLMFLVEKHVLRQQQTIHALLLLD